MTKRKSLPRRANLDSSGPVDEAVELFSSIDTRAADWEVNIESVQAAVERADNRRPPLLRENADAKIAEVRRAYAEIARRTRAPAFADSFDLKGELLRLWSSRPLRVSYFERRKPSKIAKSKAFAAKLQTRIRSLQMVLFDASHYEVSLITHSATAPRGLTLRKWRDLLRLLSELGYAAAEARPTKQHFRDHFAIGIRRVYVKAFGPGAPRISRSDQYSGPFFAFVESVWPLFGLPKLSNNALGKLAQEAIAAVDGKSQSPNSRRISAQTGHRTR